MPFRPRPAVSGAVLAAAAVLLCPAPAQARPAAPAGPGWSAAPAPGRGAGPSAQDRPYFYLEGAPGTVLSDRLSLGNPTRRPVTVQLRGTGTGAAGDTGSWLRFAAGRVTVPPRTRASVPFTVTVPKDAAPGDHPGTITATGGPARHGGPAARRTVPVHLRVAGPALSALTAEDVSVHRRGSAAVIRYTLVNRGNTALTPRLAVRADGVLGPVLRRAARTLPLTLQPGRRARLTEDWPDPPALDAVRLRLTVTAAGGAQDAVTASYTALPWGVAAGAALVPVAGAAGLVAVRRRRRRRRRDERRDGGGDSGAGGGSNGLPGTAAALPAAAATVLAAALLLGAALVLPAAGTARAASPAEAPGGHRTVQLSTKEAGKGGTLTVTGRGWRPKALLTLLICGQNMIGGTNSCANGDGRAVTTDAHGAFRRRLPVAEPPKPCPCVVHVATVTGAAAAADAAFKVAGHPVAPLPKERTGGRLAVLSPPRLAGSSGLLTWFGAPPQRELTVTVGNLGSAPARNPVFRVGTSHGVFAPRWEEQQWRGTVPPGRKVQVKLPVELAAGAHGDYLVSLEYGGKVLAEQPWGVGRPWGVTLFWVLLCVVVPTAVFRIGMALVGRVRPRRPAGHARPRIRTRRTTPAGDRAVLPWFTPDTAPSTTTSTKRPTSKGST